MNSNNRSDRHDYSRASSYKPEPVIEDTLKSEKIQVERKTFVFSLKENPRGRFLRITEDVGGRRDAIIVPVTGLGEFARVILTMAEVSEGLAAGPPPEEAGGEPRHP
jgi:hypothetical protein